MKRYGIIGGTFDPIHNGHLYIAYEALIKFKLDKVIFMPACIQPFKTDKKVADAVDRLNMVSLAVFPYKEFEVSDYEIKNEGVSYTYKTLKHFKKKFLDENEDSIEIYFIIGADCIMELETWTCIKEIFKSAKIIGFSRQGYLEEEVSLKSKYLKDKYGADIKFISIKNLEISSTDIRKRIGEGIRVDFFLPDKVLEYINTKSLYKEEFIK
ncbi:nicotinate-nucleotide adenylyltransferase [Clostridium sp. BJN0001]|uniref:nicotinate-nucleotide adenylyltransferase n=1 Tax=Clostridium sp. BJN0001 TaxID=2930219 RepID=UPI001FD08D20|nr:nicotinate-nucleotide adenylyltransferase [Clostridium sp. BJN0001]